MLEELITSKDKYLSIFLKPSANYLVYYPLNIFRNAHLGNIQSPLLTMVTCIPFFMKSDVFKEFLFENAIGQLGKGAATRLKIVHSRFLFCISMYVRMLQFSRCPLDDRSLHLTSFVLQACLEFIQTTLSSKMSR